MYGNWLRCCALTHAMTWACPKPCSLWIRTVGLRIVHSILILTDSTLIIPWLYVTRSGLSHWDAFLHNFIPLAILIFNSYLVELSSHGATLRDHHFQHLRGKTLTLEKHVDLKGVAFKFWLLVRGVDIPIARWEYQGCLLIQLNQYALETKDCRQ